LNTQTNRSLGALALVALISSGCGANRQPADPRGYDVQQAVGAFDAFQKHPTEQTWGPVRAIVLKSHAGPALVSSAVEALSAQPVPTRVLDAAAVDLATNDWPATMKWIRQYNVVARTDRSLRGRQVVAATARLAWLMLALRANYARDAVDLTHTDLRDSAEFVGQAMNLENVDFSGSTLRGGTWRSANVLGALFSGVAVDGALHCDACSFGATKYPGALKLVNDRWVSSTLP
jgi:hypothetical protein